MQNRLNVDLRFSQPIQGMVATFEEWQAGVAANLDMWKWENNKYSPEFKAKAVAWYRLHISVENHVTDASIPKPRKAKK